MHNAIIHPRVCRLLRTGDDGSDVTVAVGNATDSQTNAMDAVDLDDDYLAALAAAKHSQVHSSVGGISGDVAAFDDDLVLKGNGAKARRLYNQRKHRRTRDKKGRFAAFADWLVSTFPGGAGQRNRSRSWFFILSLLKTHHGRCRCAAFWNWVPRCGRWKGESSGRTRRREGHRLHCCGLDSCPTVGLRFKAISSSL